MDGSTIHSVRMGKGRMRMHPTRVQWYDPVRQTGRNDDETWHLATT